MSIFDEVTGRYRAPRLADLPPPPSPSIWRSAQKGLSDFMDSPWGGLVEVPLTVVTAPQKAVESAIGAFRGGLKLSEEERQAYGREAYDRDAAVPKFDGGESVFDTAYRRLRGRGYDVPGGGQIARETIAGVGELVGAPSTATVMGLSRDPSEAGGYRPIAESEQQAFEQESPILSRVAAPLRVGVDFAGSLATDPTSALAFGPKLASRAGGTIAKEAAENAIRAAALETAKAERLASRLFVPGAAVGALGGTLEAGRAISEDGLFSPEAIEATLGAGVSAGMGALAAKNAFRGLDSLPKPPVLGPEPVPERPTAQKRTERAIPTDDLGQSVYPGEEGLSPAQREALTGVVGARVRALTLDQASQPTGRRPILGGPALNDVQGYQGTPSHKTGTALEGIPEGPKEIADAIRRDKGNALELRVRDAVLKNDPELSEYLDRLANESGDGDDSFPVERYSVARLPPPPEPTRPDQYRRQVEAEPLRPFDAPSEPDRYAYRARTVGEQGIPATGHAQASLSEQDVRRMAPSRTEDPQEVARVDLKGLDPSKYEVIDHPSGQKWVRFRENLPEESVETVGPIDAIDRAAADKATPPVRAAVESADVADLAQATGLTLERAQKGADDVRADGIRELSPEAVAIKKTVLQADPSMLEAPVDLRADPTEPLQTGTSTTQPEPQRALAVDGEQTPQAPFNVDNVRKAFPTGKITESEGTWDVRLPGNRNIRVTPTGDVEFSLGDLQRGHPDAAGPEGLKPGMKVVGSWQRIGRGGLISLAKEAGQGTLDHESFHAAMELVLSEREKKAVLKRFGNEEKAADAYGAWSPADKSNAVFGKIAAFFQRLYRNLFPNAESVFGKVRSGEAFNREGTPFPDAPLPRQTGGSQPPAPPTPPAPPGPPGDQPVSGRRVEPGESPRVEHRIDDLAAATADAGVPEIPLDRDTVQTWESLDPKVKDILRTYDEQKFYDIMSRRNLDAPETQAFDAVIRGKSERLEKLKQQERTPETDAQIAAETLGYIAAQRAYVNDGTGLARALAARARVMAAAQPAEAFSRRLGEFKVSPQMAGAVLTAIRKDPSLLDLIREEARQRRLSVEDAPPPKAPDTASVPFMITRKIEADLKALGYDDAAIGKMSPSDAWRILSAEPVKKATPAERTVARLSDRLKALGLSDEQSGAFVKALREDSSFLPDLEAAVKNEAEPTDALLKKVFREIKGVTDEQAAEILTAFKENPDNLAPLIQSALGTGKLRKALEWWRAGLLSSFSTDVANVSGNVAEHHIRLAETGIASGLDWLLQKVYGGDRARFAGEVGAEMAGANMSFGPAVMNLVRNLKDVVTLKDKPLDLTKKLEGQVGAIGGTTGKIVRAIGYGRMGAMDVFQKEWGGGAEAGKLAYRKAANSLPAGTSKAEIRAKAAQILQEMADPENASHSDLMAAVEKAQDERTFQEKRVGSLTDALSGVVRRNPIMAFVAPFVNTPGNIANAIIKRSPLGAKRAIQAFGEFKKAQSEFLAGKIDEATFSAARGKLADAIASPLMGTALLAGFAAYANAGGMTGSGPTDERAKNALKESGWSPYSFVLTDPTTGKKAYIPFNRFEPVSSLLGFAADMAEAKNIRNLSFFDKALGSVVENLTSKSYLTGLSEAASLITKPKEFAPQYIKGFVGSWVPNIIGRTASAIDPIQRDTRASKTGFAGLPEAIVKNVQSRIPFASQALPARVSSTGQPVERPGNALTRFASPAQPTIEKPERFLEREYGRLGWAPTAPTRSVTVKGIRTDLTDDEFGIMTKAQRRASDEARNLIRSAHYKSLPDDQRELLLDRLYSKWKARGRQKIRPNLERRVAREARA